MTHPRFFIQTSLGSERKTKQKKKPYTVLACLPHFLLLNLSVTNQMKDMYIRKLTHNREDVLKQTYSVWIQEK
jgi:hypothetical protein